MYKYGKTSKSNFFTITIHSLLIFSESKNLNRKFFKNTNLKNSVNTPEVVFSVVVPMQINANVDLLNLILN